MARLWAAKILVEQAHDYKDLAASDPKAKDELLYPFRDQLQEAMHLITDAVTRLGNSKLVQDYERAYTIPKDSKWYGKNFNKIVPADAEKMLDGVQKVADGIVREIRQGVARDWSSCAPGGRFCVLFCIGCRNCDDRPSADAI